MFTIDRNQRTEPIMLTPKRAAQSVKNAAPNRHTQPLRVRMFQEIVEQGWWEQTHQGIAYDVDGRLVDGLHRCTAIAQGDIAVPILATWGLPKSALNAVDLGKIRDPADICNITEQTPERVTRMMGSVARAMVEGFTGSSSDRVSHQRVIRLMVQHFDPLAFCREHGGRLPNYVLAPVARAWYSKDRDRLARFLEIMKDGQISDPSEQPASKLAFQLQGLKNDIRTSGQRAEFYRKTEATILNFLKGDRVKQICEVKKEQFPIPAPE